MEFDKYLAYFEEIVESNNPPAPYDEPDYMEYARLNWSRMNRWLKRGQINEETTQKLQSIEGKQKWVLITEPWCGDAAHSVPFIAMMAEKNPNIELEIQLRDSDSEIDNYLTNGGKSIPKLVIRDENGKDITTWGPRPTASQDFFLGLKEKGIDMDEVKAELQKWYNTDKGQAIQEDFLFLIKN